VDKRDKQTKQNKQDTQIKKVCQTKNKSWIIQKAKVMEKVNYCRRVWIWLITIKADSFK